MIKTYACKCWRLESSGGLLLTVDEASKVLETREFFIDGLRTVDNDVSLNTIALQTEFVRRHHLSNVLLTYLHQCRA